MDMNMQPTATPAPLLNVCRVPGYAWWKLAVAAVSVKKNVPMNSISSVVRVSFELLRARQHTAQPQHRSAVGYSWWDPDADGVNQGMYNTKGFAFPSP